MKKAIIVFIIIVFIICGVVGIISSKKDNVSGKRTKYLIDILIKNEDKLDVDYIQMGIIDSVKYLV